MIERCALVLSVAVLAILLPQPGDVSAEEPPLTGLSLGQAVDFALAHHPALRAQMFAEDASREQVGVARTAYLPQVGLTLQVSAGTGNVLRGPLFPAPNIPAVSGPPTARDLSDVAVGSLLGVGASWDVLGLVSGMAQVDAALVAQAQSHAATQAHHLEIAYRAADQFLDLLARQEIVRAARASVERARVFDTIVKALVDHALRPGADASRADAELALASTLLVRAEQAESMSRAALARALGVADREVTIATGLLSEVPPADLRQAAAEHPLLNQATADVQAAQARRYAVSLQYLPRLEVIAALWTRGSGLTSGTVEPSSGAGLVPDTPNMAAGLVLTWPALDVIKTRARTRVESALVQQASAARDDAAQAIETQVRLARDTLVAARRVAVNTAVELAAARAAESQATARYRAGLTPVVEVAEAQRLLTQAESDDAAERVNIWRALLLLSRAVGDLSPFLNTLKHGGREMWLVLAALRRPLTGLVAVLAIVLSAGLAVRRAPVDIFPNLGVPVVYVVQPFAGMSPGQMESQLVNYYEYHFLYVSGIEHIESQSIQGMAMLKLYFHPDTDIAQALAQVTAMAFRSTSFMPPGTLPPFIVRFDAGSIPVGQLVFSSDSRSDQEIQDLALYRVRPLLATLPGVSSPPPSGGKVRTIVVYADPERMRAYRLSPNDIAVTLARENLTLPAGNIRVGDLIPITTTNATVRKIADLENIPLRIGAGPTVFLRDVARVADDADIVYNIALVNGHRTVYMPVTKRADASTLDVVNGVKAALPQMRALVPEDLHISLEFDQSVYVTGSIRGLITEGALGAALTGLMVLLFLGDWRSALIVVLTIPFSVLASVVGLRLVGQSINIMTLGGLALAIGILVDEATVAIENIHTHLSQSKKAGQAVVDAMREVMVPRLLAMLCVLAVFIPSFAMVGIGRALFPPLALAVAFSMVASYFLSSTLVPVLAVWLFRTTRVRPNEGGGPMARLQERYGRAWVRLLAGRRPLVLGYAALCVGALLLAGQLGTELFPRTDTGQFQLRVRAPAGTRLEKTEEVVRSVDQLIRDEVGPQFVSITLANIGNPAWSFPVNGVYVWNAGPQEALLLVALKEGRRPSLEVLQERLRQKLSAAWPAVKFSFEAGDIVSQVMNFGSPTPVSVTVSGSDLAAVRSFTEKLAAQLRLLRSLRDVQIPQPLDYPTLEVEIDRERAGQLGVTVDTVGRSLVGATSSSVLTTPNFFIDPKSGVPYRVALRVPENLLRSADDLRNLPVMPDGAPRPLLADIATVTPGRTFGEIDHRNSQRTLSVSANVAGRDLKQAQTDVAKAVASMGAPPRGLKVAIHGQIEQMETTLASLREGLILAIGVVLLLLSANFQSLRAALLVLSTVPAVLAGVVTALYVTGSTLNVQSMMGAIMSIGVAVANAVLVITFARERRRQGDSPSVAAVQAARSRLRPVLMTSLAMIAGMLPMALGLGEGGEQSAPLGRAVIGGLAAATMATLFVLPAIYAIGESAGRYSSASLDPNDPESADFEQATS